MSFFRIEEKNNLKTNGLKPKRIKTYSSIEEIIEDVETIKLSPKEEGKDIIIDMIYKLLILYRGYNLEIDDVNNISKNVSNTVWDAIEDVVKQLKENFSEEELLKKAKKSRKDMYIDNFLYGDNIGTMISLFYERTSFDSEYELANDCTYEPMEIYTCYKLEESAKKYLQSKIPHTMK